MANNLISGKDIELKIIKCFPIKIKVAGEQGTRLIHGPEEIP